ncbi:MAG: DUF488 domain-containing protein, partial [Streptosporangiaceae bacterium]
CRAYDDVQPEDGARILVDRLWPRGLARERANLTEWLRQVAPSDRLRRWYGHAEDRFPEFCRRYLRELDADEPAAGMARLRGLAQAGTVTLLTAAREVRLSQAAVLLELLAQDGRGAPAAELGGDPACWQRRVCPSCGSLAEVDPPTKCTICGEDSPD